MQKEHVIHVQGTSDASVFDSGQKLSGDISHIDSLCQRVKKGTK